ncbi:MAG: hypothetical protein HC837_14825 [Chloroflexaceae bacterium]|nr:hypothetical protein [Chloroflexaceae bacterium]
MASDSRLTLDTRRQQDDQQVVHLAISQTDANYKTFLAPNHIGISTFGAAEIQGVPISGSIDSFIHEHLNESTDIDAVPQMLIEYFQEMPLVKDTGFHVAGYKRIDKHHVQRIWRVWIKKKTVNHINVNGGQGASWDGESDILSRLIKPVWVQDETGNMVALPNYPIQLQFFTLQDAIDYAVYALRTTIDSIRFQVRPKTVGGPIDILVIQPGKSFWVKRKELRVS